MRFRRLAPLAALLLAVALPLAVTASEDAEPAAPAQVTPCEAPEHRQFDFWLGTWTVTKPDGGLAGRNVISSVLGGCGLREEWSSAGSPYAGTSLNLYDRARGVWHQTWLDNQGGLLLLEGGVRDSSMILEGERPGEKGAVRHRITWTPLAEGGVRQLWESSADGGSTWKVLFDGLYQRE
jgi:hypothetical protein